MRFGGLLFCNATSDRLETGWLTPWDSGLSIWIETSLWKQGVSFLELFKIKDKTLIYESCKYITGHIWDFGRLLFCNRKSDSPDIGQMTFWSGVLLIKSETGLWKRSFLFITMWIYIWLYASSWKALILLFLIRQLFSYYLEMLHIILLNIWSHFHFIWPFFKHLYYLKCIYLFVYSFIYSLLTEKLS